MAGAASWQQNGYRNGNDDGSKSAYTYINAINVSSGLIPGVTYILALLIKNGGTVSGTIQFKWQYNKNSAGWNDITTSSSNIKAVSSSNLTDGEDTTQRLGAGTFTSNNNSVCNNNATTASQTVVNGEETETILAVQVVAADVSNGDTIEYRCVLSTGTVFSAYNKTGAVTVDKNRSGSTSATLGTITGTLTGTLKVQGTLSKTLGTLTLSSASVYTEPNVVHGYNAISEAPISSLAEEVSRLNTCTRTNPISGFAIGELGYVDCITIRGSLDKTLGALTASSAEKLKIQATLTKTLGALTLSSSGVLLSRMRVILIT